MRKRTIVFGSSARRLQPRLPLNGVASLTLSWCISIGGVAAAHGLYRQHRLTPAARGASCMPTNGTETSHTQRRVRTACAVEQREVRLLPQDVSGAVLARNPPVLHHAIRSACADLPCPASPCLAASTRRQRAHERPFHALLASLRRQAARNGASFANCATQEEPSQPPA